MGSSPIFRIEKKKDSNEITFESFLFPKPKRPLNPGSRSPLRFGRCRAEIPRISCTPSSVCREVSELYISRVVYEKNESHNIYKAFYGVSERKEVTNDI